MVDSVSTLSSHSPQTAGPGAPDDVLGKDDFLTLLVTQLQNQDPLNPTDNTEFIAQLAQFSSLEGIKNLESTMSDVASNVSSMQKWGLSDLIDRTVKVEGANFDYAGSPVTLEYSLGGRASSVAVSIYDASGNLVKQVDAGSANPGAYEAIWDGTDLTGKTAASGTYKVAISAVDPAGKAVEAATYVKGKVSSVTFGDNGAEINVGNLILTQDDILAVY